MTSPSHYIITICTIHTSYASSKYSEHSTIDIWIEFDNTKYYHNKWRKLHFGDIQSPKIKFRSKECMVYLLPKELMYKMEYQNNIKRDINLQSQYLQLLSNGRIKRESPEKQELNPEIPIVDDDIEDGEIDPNSEESTPRISYSLILEKRDRPSKTIAAGTISLLGTKNVAMIKIKIKKTLITRNGILFMVGIAGKTEFTRNNYHQLTKTRQERKLTEKLTTDEPTNDATSRPTKYMRS
ncbi:15057_t:CDS:2 [Acaulospora morrowiae]|uniref:15057_t:CDS:1 n=1 Tax=Acaulospora morrowiae TaxID=94023 RepID=A0A9N8VTR1_9GLOM|nr:15057_t:CDS:2 [Acaulospora morrowiae]